VAGPVQDAPIACHKPVPLKSSSDDDAVGRVAMEIWQNSGSCGDDPGDRYLNQSGFKKLLAPRGDVLQDSEPSLLLQHPQFPE